MMALAEIQQELWLGRSTLRGMPASAESLTFSSSLVKSTQIALST